MYTAQPKKMLIIHILEILKKYTDEDHRLSQKEIADILRTEYDEIVDRKTVKRNLMDLIDFGYEIEYSESVRMVPDRATGKLEESHFLSDFYLVQHIRTMPDLSLHSQQLFYTIEVVDEAISKGRQISFTYNSYGTDKKLHPRKDNAGNIRK